MHRSLFKLSFGVALGSLVLAQPGCSSQNVDVTGRVTYNGSPLNLPGGEIVFVGPKDTQVVATIAADGTYRAVGIPLGINRVAAYYVNPDAKASGGKHTKPLPKKTAEGETPQAPSSATSIFLTPSKYAVVDTSELSVDVKKGTVFDVNLRGPTIR